MAKSGTSKNTNPGLLSPLTEKRRGAEPGPDVDLFYGGVFKGFPDPLGYLEEGKVKRGTAKGPTRSRNFPNRKD